MARSISHLHITLTNDDTYVIPANHPPSGLRVARSGHTWLDVRAGDDIIRGGRRLTVLPVRLYRWVDGIAKGEEKETPLVKSGRAWLG